MAPTSAVERPVVQNSSSFSICQSFRSSTSWSQCIRTASKSTTLLPWFLMKLNRGLDSQVQLYGFLVDDDHDYDDDYEYYMILMRTMMIRKCGEGQTLPAQSKFKPVVLYQLIKEVDVRLGDDDYDDADNDDDNDADDDDDDIYNEAIL